MNTICDILSKQYIKCLNDYILRDIDNNCSIIFHKLKVKNCIK